MSRCDVVYVNIVHNVSDQNSLEYVRIHSELRELCENYDRTLRIVDNRAASHPYIFKCEFLGNKN